jgi:hypothetical protein
MHQVVDQRIDVVDLLRPEAARAGQRGAALEFAFLADHLREPRDFLRHRHVLLDEVVEHIGDLGELRAALNGQLRAGIATAQRDQRAVNGGQLFGMADRGCFGVFKSQVHGCSVYMYELGERAVGRYLDAAVEGHRVVCRNLHYALRSPMRRAECAAPYVVRQLRL